MHVLVEVDHERDLTRQTNESEVQQPPTVVGFDAEACSRGQKGAGRTGTRDSLVADESTAEPSRQLILLLGACSRSQQRSENRSQYNCASLHLPAKFP